MSFVPATVDLTGTNAILQGTDWVRDFAITNGGSPVNLTGYTTPGRCNFRLTKATAGILLSPTIDITDAAGGIIRMTITPTQTEGLGTSSITGVYDVEIVLTAGSKVERILQGSFAIDPEVTHT